MRRIVLLILIILASEAHAAFGASFPRHVDPEQLSLRNPEPFPLFELYSHVYGSIASGDYAGAEEIMNLFQEIASPPSTDRALQGYNLLLREVIDDLNASETYLKLAYRHLTWLDDPQAERALRLAEPILQRANGTTLNLDTASKGIASILKGSPDRLLEGVSNVSSVVDRLQIMLFEGLEEVERIRQLRDLGLAQTRLEIQVDNVKPYLGDTVTLSGALSLDDGSGLAGKAVQIIVDGVPEATLESGSDGGYLYRLIIPYRYIGSLRVYAQYFPRPEDNHLPAVSETITLNPVYYSSTLVLRGPDTVYPGKSFRVSGRVSFLQQPLKDMDVTVSYMGSSQTSKSDEGGEYGFTLHTPGYASEGVGRITVASEPRGIYGPSASTITVIISREQVELNIESPTVLLVGRTGAISGTVTSGGAPLPGCLVEIELGETTVTTETDLRGWFTSPLTYPLTKLSTRLEYRVIVTPTDPWYSIGTHRNSFYLLNPLPFSGMLLILGLFAASRRRPPQPPTISDAVLPPAPQPPTYTELPGMPGLYVKAIKLVARITGEQLLPSHTIREYLAHVEPSLKHAVYKLFKRISIIYEAWAYGREKDNPPTNKVEKILDELGQEDG